MPDGMRLISPRKVQTAGGSVNKADIQAMDGSKAENDSITMVKAAGGVLADGNQMRCKHSGVKVATNARFEKNQ